MSLPPSIKEEEYLPNPTKKYGIDEAYSDVYKAVVEASMHSENKPKYKELENKIPIGYALSLLNCYKVNLHSLVKFLEEIKLFQKEVANINNDEIEKIEEVSTKWRSTNNKINKILKTNFLNIILFKNEEQIFKAALNSTKYKELEFVLPNIMPILIEFTKIKEVKELYKLNFESIDSKISSVKENIESQIANIKETNENLKYKVEEEIEVSVIENLDEAKNIINELKTKMLERPKLIDLNQANISKEKLINIRKLNNAL